MPDADADLIARIEADLAEEKELRARHEHAGGAKPLTEEDRARLDALEVHLDQLWDLLRQRRARRESNQDVAAAQERPASIVESYRN